MAETMRGQPPRKSGPAVILVEPQLGENIGTAARAMLNFGLTELRLVQPRDGWPSERAVAASSGATLVLDNARIFDSFEDAIGDLTYVCAATARRRDMVKPELTPHQTVREIQSVHPQGNKTGIAFGRERWGLTNDEVALADAITVIDANPTYSSLNLAMAVLLLGYEWFQLDPIPDDRVKPTQVTAPADKSELLAFFEHLERELDACGFLRVVEKRPTMVRNIRTMFQRATLTDQEIRTLRGVVACLTRR